ncbi:hypothetical protein CGX12_11790 [Zobellella denitrificans]|nr:hypothetical protein CGX12_11790 [Zobellella denitrificans]
MQGCLGVIFLMIILFAISSFFGDSSEPKSNSQTSGEQKKKPSTTEQCSLNDSQCLFTQHNLKATIDCKPLIQRLAKYDYKWSDGMLTPTFSHFRHDAAANTMTYIGDQIRMVNGLGNEIRHTYECVYDMGAQKIVDFSAKPGRIQS